jgi:hypothetical protein
VGCPGDTPSPCCWLDGVLCPFLRDDGDAPRRWVCTLREKYGNWDDVHTDAGYLKLVKPVWDRVGISDCGDWPGPGQSCGECGLGGAA